MKHWFNIAWIVLTILLYMGCNDDQPTFVAKSDDGIVRDVSTDVDNEQGTIIDDDPSREMDGSIDDLPANNGSSGIVDSTIPDDTKWTGDVVDDDRDKINVVVIDERQIRQELGIIHDCIDRLMIATPFRCDVTTAVGDIGIVFALAGAPGGMTIAANGGIIDWTPSADQVGRYTFEILALRGSDNVATTMVLNVYENHPPTIAEMDCPDSVAIGAVWTCKVVAADQDGDILSYSLTDAPGGMDIDADGIVTFSPGDGDEAYLLFEVNVSDGLAQTSRTMSVQVYDQDNPPRIRFLDCPKIVDEDLTYSCSYELINPDSFEVILYLEDAPEKMILDRFAQVILWDVPNVDTIEKITYNLVLEDDFGVSDNRNGFFAYPQNDPPELVFEDCPEAIEEDQEYLCKVAIVDPDGDTVFVSLDENPEKMILDEATQTIRWTVPNIPVERTEDFAITISDGKGTGGIVYERSVLLIPVNDPPTVVFDDCPDRVSEDQLFRCSYHIVDIDGDSVRVDLNDGPEGMISGDETISWQVPNILIPYEESFSLVIDDGIASEELEFRFMVDSANDVPTANFTLCPTKIYEDQLYRCAITVSDIDGDEVTIDLVDEPTGMRYENETILWSVPETYESRELTYQVVLSDGFEEATHDISVTVLPVNDPARITFGDCPEQVSEDAQYRCSYTVFDIDGDLVQVRLENQPAGMIVDQQLHEVLYTVPNILQAENIVYRLVADDGTVAVGYSRSFRELPVNDLPTLTLGDCPDIAIEDQAYRCTYSVTDIDGDTVEVSLAGAPNGMTHDRAGRTIDWLVPNTTAEKVITIELVAEDGIGERRIIKDIRVYPRNDLPGIRFLDCPTDVDEDEQYECYYEVSDIDGDNLTVTLLSRPDGMVLHSQDRKVTWSVPNILSAHSELFQLNISDGQGEIQSRQDVIVHPVNDPPILTFGQCPATVDENTFYACHYTVQDVDNDQVSVVLLTRPDGMTIDTTAQTISWQTPENVTEPTEQAFTLSVSDQAVSIEVGRTMVMMPVNNAPRINFDNCPNRVDEDEVFLCTIDISDADDDPATVVVSLENAPAGMSLDPDGRTIRYLVPNILAETSVTVKVTASDGLLITWVPLTFIEIPVNDPPSIVLNGCPGEIAEDQTFACTYTIDDPENDSVSLTLNNPPIGMTIDQTTKVLRYSVPNQSSQKTIAFQLVASDGKAQASVSHGLTLLPVNDPPTITFNNCPTSVDEDQVYTCNFTIEDIDGDSLTVRLSEEPSGMLINQGSGRIIWTVPNTLSVTVHNFKVIVDDGQTTVTGQNSVSARPVNDPPEITLNNCPAEIAEDQVYRCGYQILDIDGDTVTVTLSGQLTGMLLDSNARTITWTVPNTLIRQELSYNIVLNDGSVQVQRAVSVVTVPVNDPPVITIIDCPTQADEDLSYTCSFGLSDPDNDPVDVNISGQPQGMTVDKSANEIRYLVPNTLIATTITYQIVAFDNYSQTSVNRNLTLNPVNDPPELTFSDCPTEVAENVVYRCSYTVQDIDGDQVAVALAQASQGFSVDTLQRSITYTSPRIESDTLHSYTVALSDGKTTRSYDRTVRIIHVNAAPVLEEIGNKSIQALDTLVFSVHATDPDGDPLTYAITGLPLGASFVSSNGRFEWTPTIDDQGSHTITIMATDGTLADSEALDISVIPAGPQPTSEEFTASAHPSLKIDILFVVDTSGSMNYVTTGVSDYLDQFIAQLDSRLDYQLAMMLAHDQGTWSGRLFYHGSTPRILKKSAYASITALKAAFADNFKNFVSGQPDGGEAGLFSLNKAVFDLLTARAAGNAATTVPDLDQFFRNDAGLYVVFLADENDVCYRYNYSVSNIYGNDTDSGTGEKTGYLRDCFPAGLADSQKTVDARNLTAETLYGNLVALKEDRPVSLSGIIFKDMDNPSLYPSLGLNAENQTGRGYKETIKTGLGDSQMSDDDPQFLDRVVDLLAIKQKTLDFATSLARLGSMTSATEVEFELAHPPDRESLVAFLTTAGGTSFAEPIAIEVKLKYDKVVGVTIPPDYYFSDVTVVVEYDYLP